MRWDEMMDKRLIKDVFFYFINWDEKNGSCFF